MNMKRVLATAVGWGAVGSGFGIMIGGLRGLYLNGAIAAQQSSPEYLAEEMRRGGWLQPPGTTVAQHIGQWVGTMVGSVLLVALLLGLAGAAAGFVLGSINAARSGKPTSTNV
jgi:hypothetical protein